MLRKLVILTFVIAATAFVAAAAFVALGCNSDQSPGTPESSGTSSASSLASSVTTMNLVRFPAVVSNRAQFGFLAPDGSWAIKPQFDEAGWFNEGLAPIRRGQHWGYVDDGGNLVIPLQFTHASSFTDGFAAVGVGTTVSPDSLMAAPKAYGFIDKTGQMVIPAEWNNAGPFRQGLAPVKRESAYGFVDQRGRLAIPLKFENVGQFSDGLAYAQSDGKWGYIDTSGNWVIPPQYKASATNPDEVSGLLAPGSEDFSPSGIEDSPAWENSVSDPVSVPVRQFENGVAAVMVADSWQYIDRRGKRAFDGVFEAAGDFSEGLAAVKMNGKWGFIDAKGAMVISPQFDSGGEGSPVDDFSYLVRGAGFQQGLAAVVSNGKTGYIDTSGKFVILPQFDYGRSFAGGLAFVGTADEFEVIDRTGQVVCSVSFASLDEATFTDTTITLPTGPDSPFHEWGETAEFEGILLSVGVPKPGVLNPSQIPGVVEMPTVPGDHVVEALVTVTNNTGRPLSIDSWSFDVETSDGSTQGGDNVPTLDPSFPMGPVAPGETAQGYEAWIVTEGVSVVRVTFQMETASGRTTTQIWGDIGSLSGQVVPY